MMSTTLATGSLYGSPVQLPSLMGEQLSSSSDPFGLSHTGSTGLGSDLSGPPIIVGGSGMDAGFNGSISTPAPFSDLLTEAVGQVEQLEKQAKVAVEGLISGRGVDVHEAMIATEKAEMGFELMLSVRSKALAAYQQIVGMQF